jgi:glycosyltransferase involved in cell wall biosynthesis
MCEQALRLQGAKVIDPLAHHLLMLEVVAQEAQDFDIVHFHVDYLHFPVSRREKIPSVTTLHGRLDIADIHPMFQEFFDMPLVSISDAQREPMRWASWIGTVHHGLPEHSFRPQAKPGEYLAFLGRISPEKRVDRAIEIAKRAGMPIKIAAKVDPADREYFEANIRSLMDDPLVDYIGEIGDGEKCEFLSNAYALLFPIDWPEPFGLVMIEAMACGTPVIAFSRGSVPEIIEDGVTGYLVSDIDEAVGAVERAGTLDRRLCRRVFEDRFSVRRMCSNYLEVYRKVLEGGTSSARGSDFLSVAA